MKKMFIILIILLCCTACGTKTSITTLEKVEKDFNDTIYGHKDKKESMTSHEAYTLLNDSIGSLYDSIEYYDMVKYALVDNSNYFYAFRLTSGDDSYYFLVDIYNGITTAVTAEDLNISE